MRVFLTGATGFVGSYLVPELIAAGHHVVGLTRSDSGAEALARAKAEVVRGDVNDLEQLRAVAARADGVIHAAFNHDFANAKQSSEDDRHVVATLGAALAGTDRPLIITSGTGLVRSKTGGAVLETDDAAPEVPRAATEQAAAVLEANGVRVIVVRLPQVHDRQKHGRLSLHIEIAKQKGRVAYVGDGQNRVPAVHVTDAVRLYRRALENGVAGARYHAVAEEGVTMRAFAEAIGTRLDLPVDAISPAEAPAYFGGLAHLAMSDLPASGARTRRALDWQPTGVDLVTDLQNR